MDRRTFREDARERIEQVKEERQYHERELERLNKVAASLGDYLANDTEDTPDARPNYPSPMILPPTDKTASSILMPFLRENPNLSRDKAYVRLHEAGYDFKGNWKRVASNALSMARRKLQEESGEAQTATEEE